MKKTVFIIILSLISLGIFANNDTGIQKFKEANKLYSENKFEDAAKLYEELITEGYSSFELFYNTANTYYRMNKTGKAIYWYEKAKMLNPKNDDLKYNLDLAQLRVKNLPPDVPKIFPVRLFKQITYSKSYKFWGFISLSVFILFLIVLYFYFAGKNSKTKKIRLLTATIFLFVSVISFIFMQYQINKIKAHNTAIIVNKEVTAKSSPDNSAADLFKVYEGYKVKIESKNENWCEVTLTDGRKAWIKKDDLMIL